MAKLRAPLFSISASGRVGRVLCYSATRHGASARRAGRPTGQASAAQLAERERVRAATVAWLALGEPDASDWRALAVARGKNPWILFCSEYLIQQCAGASLPLLPAD
jgi:hypothetical protein